MLFGESTTKPSTVAEREATATAPVVESPTRSAAVTNRGVP
jgi:hypothetical protein